MKYAMVVAAVLLSAGFASAQTASTGVAQPAGMMAGHAVLPADTVIQVTPVQDITSIKMKQGDSYTLQVASDVSHDGVVIIPRGAPVKGTVTWRTGKGIGGKSAKFEMTFNSVNVGGRDFALNGKHRQEGRGNTVGALLGSIWISGHSAVMTSGQLVNAFTAEPITVG